MRLSLALATLSLIATARADPLTRGGLPPSAYAALSAAGYAILADVRKDATVYTFLCARPVACREPALDRPRMPGPYQFLNEPYAAGNDRAARRRRA